MVCGERASPFSSIVTVALDPLPDDVPRRVPPPDGLGDPRLQVRLPSLVLAASRFMIYAIL